MFNDKNDHVKKIKQTFDSQKELRKIPSELMTINQYNDIQERLEMISDEIETIGKICDVRKSNTLEDYQSQLDQQRKELDEETENILKKLETLKEKQRKKNIPRYKNKYQKIERQVKHLGALLKESEKVYREDYSKLLLLQEDDLFYTNQLEVVEELNEYLNHKYKALIDNKLFPTLSSPLTNRENEKSLSSNKQLLSSVNISDTSKNNHQRSSSLLLTSIDPVQKISKRFDLNERIITKKLFLNKKALSNNINKFQFLAFANDNKYMTLLRQIADDINQINNAKANMLKSPSQNHLVLKKVKSVASLLSPSITSTKASINDDHISSLSSREKKEIIIKFLETEQVKQLIYDLLYKDITRFPYPFKTIE